VKYNDLRARFVKRYHIPKETLARKVIRSFTPAEKSIFYFFIGLFVTAGILLLVRVNDAFLVKVPIRGGTLTEGVVGNPRFINPVLALSQADKDMTSLVYSGLLKANPNGSLVNDLADTIDISPDSLTYKIHIKPGAHFQDGIPVSADDVVFTIQKITDSNLKSPLFGDWAGVSVAAIDNETVTFTLKSPYAPFINNLTLGILPKHIWQNVTDDEFSFSQFNSLPVGSGPYKIENVERDSGGIPNYYQLEPSEGGSGAPYIAHLVFHFYPSEESLVNAYEAGDIQSLAGISPENAEALKKLGANVLAAPLPRIFAVFYNQGQNKALLDPAVRKALDLGTPKEDIVKKILGGYGTAVDAPLPPDLYSWTGTRATTSDYAVRLLSAQNILANAGWTKNASGVLVKKSKSGTITLSFTLSTSDNPELKATADILKEAWTNLGADVDIQIFDSGDLNQNVIRPRHYDALLFGEVVGRAIDVYPFWHSSERNDPGLNIALYANSKVDKALEAARSETDPKKREADYKTFATEIATDMPADFLYTPSFLYVVPKTVSEVNLGKLGSPEDRFLGIQNWFIETDNVWNIFVKH
jgi:peptide/nickel transport system substrate-binding protein